MAGVNLTDDCESMIGSTDNQATGAFLRQSAHIVITANASAPGQTFRSCAEAVEVVGRAQSSLDFASGFIGAQSV